MENPERSSNQTISPLLLPVPEDSDYLGQWLAILGEAYSPKPSEMAILAYRITLADLTPRQLDLAFSRALREHRTNFRPAPGEIRGYLREARLELAAAELKALPEAQLSREEASEVWESIKAKCGELGPSVNAMHSAVEKARQELAELRASPISDKGVVEITDKMRAEYERKKKEALERFGNVGTGQIEEEELALAGSSQ